MHAIRGVGNVMDCPNASSGRTCGTRNKDGLHLEPVARHAVRAYFAGTPSSSSKCGAG